MSDDRARRPAADDPAEVIAAWPGEATILSRHRPSGSWIAIAIHSTALGPAAGGTRLTTYPSLAAAIADAHRLAEGMTLKHAFAGVATGGGKAVLAVPRGLEADARGDLLDAYARLLAGLRGAFATGCDVGTTVEDMRRIARVAPDAAFAEDTGEGAAIGVHVALRAAATARFGPDGVRGRRVVIQGAGGVGARLAALLARDGARVAVADLDPAAAARAAAESGAEVVDPGAVLEEPCDVLSPCAVGGVLDRDTIPKLRCAAIVGGANNQLADPDGAAALHRRGILYVPDFVANAGGTLSAEARLEGGPPEAARAAAAGIGPRVAELLARADAAARPPLELALEIARARIADARPTVTPEDNP